MRLSATEHALLCARYGEHANSQRRMREALAEARSRSGVLDRLRALRAMERALDVDLGAVCWRWHHRADEATHPLESSVMDYIAEARGAGDTWELWIRLDRVRQVRELMDGRLVGELE
ncbi:MAG: hypothetical protein ACREKM_10065 [Longimicrobiales bacterium]